MKKVIVLVAALILSFTSICSSEESLQSTIDDQIDIEVTVYNSNLGLVKDTRKVKLPKSNSQELRFMDVAQRINPVTVHAKSLNFSENFKVLEQNYEYDLLNSSKLLDKYVGKTIKIIDENKYQDITKTVEAVLLSNNNGQIYQIGDEIYLGHDGIKVLPEIPENMIAKPTLMWLYASDVDEEHELQVSYMTGGINWKADYVMVLDQEDVSADLTGWVTVDNRSGTMYKNAKLKLMAGEVNRVREDRNRRSKGLMMEAMSDSLGGAQFEEKGLFEYHMYDLQRRTDIKNNQTKQISLLEAIGLSIEKQLVVRSANSYLTYRYQGELPKVPVDVYIKFKNEKDNNLGMPLPAGIVRLYKKDDEGSLQFIGEDRIDHTPKNEEVKLKVGKAFDIVAEKVQTDYKKVTTRMHETGWEITLRNHKDEDAMVSVIEPVQGNWNMMYNSHQYIKRDAFSIQFDVNVPANGKVKISYRIRVGI